MLCTHSFLDAWEVFESLLEEGTIKWLLQAGQIVQLKNRGK